MFSPHVSSVFFAIPLFRCMRFCKKGGTVLMKDMVKLNTPPEFDLGTHTAYVMSS